MFIDLAKAFYKVPGFWNCIQWLIGSFLVIHDDAISLHYIWPMLAWIGEEGGEMN